MQLDKEELIWECRRCHEVNYFIDENVNCKRCKLFSTRQGLDEFEQVYWVLEREWKARIVHNLRRENWTHEMMKLDREDWEVIN